MVSKMAQKRKMERDGRLLKEIFINWRLHSVKQRAIRAQVSYLRLELRTLPFGRSVCEFQLGSILKSNRFEGYKYFLRWKQFAQVSAKRKKDQKLAESHQLGVFFFLCVSM